MAGVAAPWLQGLRDGVRGTLCGCGLTESPLRFRIPCGGKSGKREGGPYNPVEHDTEAAIRAGIGALRKLIAEDKNK